MCLITKHPVQIQTAKEDIVVYKLVDEHNDYLYAPFQWIQYGMTENLPFSIREDDKFHIMPHHSYLDADMVAGGGFHTFKNFLDAEDCNKTMFDQYAIYKCIIPKGIQYIEGIFELPSKKGIEKYPSYVSKLLKFEEKCV